MAEYLIDPDVAASFLPAGVTADQEGRAAAIFGSWQSCTDGGAELLDPVRAQYMEFYVVLSCSLGGERMNRCVFCWVDKDFSLVRGLIQGYPKKLGSIALTRASRIGKAGPRVESGSRFVGTLAAGDRRLAEVEVRLDRPAHEAPSTMTGPLLHSRVFPSWSEEGTGIDELVTGGSFDQEIDEVWTGDASVCFFEAPSEELCQLSPTRVLRGYRLLFAESLNGGVNVPPQGATDSGF
jgi:acetoacetate decarboxylase